MLRFVSLRACLMLMSFLCCPGAHAAGGDDYSSGPRCSVFDGVNNSFLPWFIAFSAWVAWKKPELSSLLTGSSATPPSPVDPAKPTAEEAAAAKEWTLLNTQLYGALVSYVSPPLQAALFVDASGSGVAGIAYLKTRFGSKSTGDRAEATARLQKSYLDPRAKLSDTDLTHQYNEMQIAAADIVSAGGTRPDDELLISMFENSLPSSYAHIRQMVRYKAHTAFIDYYNDVLTQVKAEVRSATSSQFGAFQVQYDAGKGKGGKGRGKGSGGGRGAASSSGRGHSPYHSANPCFNCLAGNHTRDRCTQPPATCTHCGGSHHSSLCPKGPGGPARDAMGINAKRTLDRQAGMQATSPQLKSSPPQQDGVAEA